jgi:hypothetical protein
MGWSHGVLQPSRGKGAAVHLVQTCPSREKEPATPSVDANRRGGQSRWRTQSRMAVEGGDGGAIHR